MLRVALVNALSFILCFANIVGHMLFSDNTEHCLRYCPVEGEPWYQPGSSECHRWEHESIAKRKV